MKRLCAVLAALVMAFCLSPAAYAEESNVLSRPREAQYSYIDAANFEAYRGDFYLSSLSSLSRDGDDLRLEFGMSKIILRGFFSTRDERRWFTFVDGARISAADFDEDGEFTGELYTGYTSAKGDKEKASVASESAADRITVIKRHGSSEVKTADGTPLYGTRRTDAIAAADERVALGCMWNDVTAMSLVIDDDEDGKLTVVQESAECTNGVSVSTRRPSTVHIADSDTLVPVGAGRASVRFENAVGKVMQTLSVRVSDGGERGLIMECICPECGEDQGGELHMLTCGHYICAIDNAAEHSVPECAIAGHCVTDGGEHGKCSNCLKPLCTGTGHGYGVCKHEHKWQPQSSTPPTETTPGQNVSVCVSCGLTYTQIIPATGG